MVGVQDVTHKFVIRREFAIGITHDCFTAGKAGESSELVDPRPHSKVR